MVRIIDKIKENKKYIFLCLVFIILLGILNSSVFAMINENSMELKANNEDGWFTSLLKRIADLIINTIGNVAAGTVMKILNIFVLAAAAFCFLLLYLVWGLLGGSLFNMPFPDKIVFNEMSIFDPNFINPTTNSILTSTSQSTNLMQYFQGALSSLYFTFFIIAGLIMVIAAMIIGIKMALTSIAIEKAQYKETLNRWLLGIVLLFCLHFLILGIFTINEQICVIASNIENECSFTYDFTDWNIATKIAGAVKGLLTGIISVFNNDVEVDSRLTKDFEGYSGIIFYLIFAAVRNGDLIASLALLAIIGQTINLIVRYLKRFILIIFMAIIAPLVVAVDVIKRAM